jgi:hypothetical protein
MGVLIERRAWYLLTSPVSRTRTNGEDHEKPAPPPKYHGAAGGKRRLHQAQIDDMFDGTLASKQRH